MAVAAGILLHEVTREVTRRLADLVAIAGLFGAVIGSFLNVCIVRWGAEPKQSVVRPPSRCPHCGKRLAWHDNIPVLSWLLLRGRCRGCREPISIQYPLVELATAIIWASWRGGTGSGWKRSAAPSSARSCSASR